MIVLVQLLIKYALLEPFGVQTALDGLGITLLILATIAIAAAGNIINDIYDVTTDAINKPKKCVIGTSISEKTGYTLFITCNIIGVGIGFYVSHYIDKSAFFSIFVIISALLYIYASYLKGILLVGNIIISALVAASILIVGLFELTPNLTEINKNIQLTFFKIILDYALFAFMINLLREIAKDIEDIDGDYKAGLRTLPIVIGRARAKHVLIVLHSVPLLTIIFYVVTKLYKQPIALIYFLVLLIAPLIYIAIQLFYAKHKSDYSRIATLYKLVLLFGMLSLLLYPFIL